MYILQQNLFSFEQWLEIESQGRLELFFSALDLRPYVKELRSASPRGRKGQSREAILRALLAAPFENISEFTALRDRLVKDIRFRYQCGFELAKRVPSISTFSRIFAQITEKGIAQKLFDDLVEQCRDEGIIVGDTIAIDSTAIDAYEKKQPKSKSQGTGNATWGAKYDTFMNKITWFGYKVHLAVDTASELPVALEVTPANINDGDMGPALVEKVASQTSQGKLAYVLADSGYDQLKNYEAAKAHGAQAIIPLNLRNAKEPPEGFSFNGTPRCSMGYDMVYWGCEKNYLKFRCPHALGKVDCPNGMTWCSSSNYGMVVKINVKDDLRRFSLPHRGSKRWEELYDKRTSVERCHSRLKENLTANDLHVREIEKVKTHVYINAIVLLASALASCKDKKSQQQKAA
ncbi:MAG: transposase [Firmicutes bacterium]|nr:transposase [Bacillota bacterium]